MRIWHDELQNNLCYRHMRKQYDEGCQIYRIVTCKKIYVGGKPYRVVCNKCGRVNWGGDSCGACNHKLNGYFNHPAVIEWRNCPTMLYTRLAKMRSRVLEMKGPKHKAPQPLPEFVDIKTSGPRRPWQSLQEQQERLKNKKLEQGCGCNV